MSNSGRLQRVRGGFTLIEVMVALVLLAIGLLGLQALGISAARSTGLAENNSRAAATATAFMETVLRQIRTNQPPAQACVTTENGEQVSVRVDVGAPHTNTSPYVTVTVTPRGPAGAPFQLSTYAYTQSAVVPSGASCP